MARPWMIVLAGFVLACGVWLAARSHRPSVATLPMTAAPLGAELEEPAEFVEAPPRGDAEALRATRSVERHPAGPNPLVQELGPIATARPRAPRCVLVARILVLDDVARAVAGVPVGLYGDADCSWGTDARVETDVNGFASLELDERTLADCIAHSPRRWIAVAAPIARRERLELDLRAPPSEIVRLQLGATGSVRVRFDANGRELDGLVAEVVALDREIRWPEGSDGGPTLLLEVVAHELFLPCVALGSELRLGIRRREGRDVGHFVVAGPTSAGENMLHELVLEPFAPVIRARLVDGVGAPFSAREVRTLLTEDGRYRANCRATTDADGRLSIDGVEPFDERAALALEIALDPADGELEAQVGLPWGAAGEILDLGELVLAPPPVLVAGRVLSDLGQPIAGAAVHVYLASRASLHEEDGFEPGFESAASGADGAFELRGFEPARAFALRADAEGHLESRFTRFEAGARGLELRLARAGALHGWVMYEEGLAAHGFDVELLDVVAADGSATDTGHRSSSRRTWEDGFSFTFSELVPGRATVRVSLEGDAEALALVRNVEIPAGDTSRDERIQGIDLTGLLHEHTIEVRDAHGEAVPDGWIECRAHGGDGPPRTLSFGDGLITILARDAALDLRVGAPGLRTCSASGVSGSARVVLQPGLPIRLELDPRTVLSAGEWLTVMLVPAGMDDAALDALPYEPPYLWLEGHRSGRIAAPEPGEYRLVWWSDWGDESLPDAGAPIRIVDTQEEQTWIVMPDSAAVERMRARLREDG